MCLVARVGCGLGPLAGDLAMAIAIAVMVFSLLASIARGYAGSFGFGSLCS